MSKTNKRSFDHVVRSKVTEDRKHGIITNHIQPRVSHKPTCFIQNNFLLQTNIVSIKFEHIREVHTYNILYKN